MILSATAGASTSVIHGHDQHLFTTTSAATTTTTTTTICSSSLSTASSSLSTAFLRHHRIPSITISNPNKKFPINFNRVSLSSTITSNGDFNFSPPQQHHNKEDDNDEERKLPDIQTLIRRFWKVAAPYWFSEDKVVARLSLAVVFLLSLASTGIMVGFNFIGRDFMNALAKKDQREFTKQLLYYLGAFVLGIPVMVLRDYAKDLLALRWRSWMTSYYMERYLKNKSFYKIQSQSIIDNPDQRIVDDVNSFTSTALSFSLIIFRNVVDLATFSRILYGIYPSLFMVLILYSVGGTAISIFLGKGLVTLNFLQEKKEADFRYGLVRVRENAEAIAFYGGEENEKQILLQRFTSAFENLRRLLISSRNLDLFTTSYSWLIQVLPSAVVAPMYFSGKIEMGVITQAGSAFSHVLSDMSLIVYHFQQLSSFSAIIERLGEFDDLLEDKSHGLSESLNEITTEHKDGNNFSLAQSNGTNLEYYHKLLDIQNLTLETPTSKTTLIRDLSLEVHSKDHLLVIGPSGCGKTSLLRTMAGLWSTGDGNITFYIEDAEEIASLEVTTERYKGRRSRSIFFLPQRPYMILGTLRQQLLYPTWTEGPIPTQVHDLNKSPTKPSSLKKDIDESIRLNDISEVEISQPKEDDLIQVLEDVHLGYILSRFNGLDSTYEWSSVLSLGEQQRLAFARLLLSKPNLVLLDESTSALDEANEAHLYKQIKAAGITYISVGHRRTLYDYHNKVLHISKIDSDDNISTSVGGEKNWTVKRIISQHNPSSVVQNCDQPLP